MYTYIISLLHSEKKAHKIHFVSCTRNYIIQGLSPLCLEGFIGHRLALLSICSRAKTVEARDCQQQFRITRNEHAMNISSDPRTQNTHRPLQPLPFLHLTTYPLRASQGARPSSRWQRVLHCSTLCTLELGGEREGGVGEREGEEEKREGEEGGRDCSSIRSLKAAQNAAEQDHSYMYRSH